MQNRQSHQGNKAELCEWVSIILACTTLFLALPLLTSCGKGAGSIVKDVTLGTHTDPDSGDAWVQMITLLDTGNLLLPALNLPIWNPEDPDRPYGRLALRPATGNRGEIDISVNLSLAAKIKNQTNDLPNGSPLPMSVPDSAKLIGLPVGSGGSRIYLAFSEDTAVLGTAIVIREFDKIGDKIGSINVFPAFRFPNDVTGVAGIFTSPRPSESGIAFFADLAPLLDQIGTELASSIDGPIQLANDGSPVRVEIRSVRSSRKRVEKMYGKLYKLNQKKRVVTIR